MATNMERILAHIEKKGLPCKWLRELNPRLFDSFYLLVGKNHAKMFLDENNSGKVISRGVTRSPEDFIIELAADDNNLFTGIITRASDRIDVDGIGYELISPSKLAGLDCVAYRRDNRCNDKIVPESATGSVIASSTNYGNNWRVMTYSR